MGGQKKKDYKVKRKEPVMQSIPYPSHAGSLPRFPISVPDKTDLPVRFSATQTALPRAVLVVASSPINLNVVMCGPVVSEGRTRRLLSTNKAAWRYGPFPHSKRIGNP